MSTSRESAPVEFFDVMRALLRGWIVIAAAVIVCLLGGIAVLVWATPVWTGKASVLVRQSNPLSGGLSEQLGGALGSAAATALLGGNMTTVETGMAILRSRELVGEVVDSAQLTVVVTSPKGTRPTRVVAESRMDGAFRPVTLSIAAGASGFRVTGKNVDTVVAAGGTVRLAAGTVRLAADPVAPATVRISDREDVVSRLVKSVTVERSGGDVINVAWPANDSLSAPEAANLLVRRFLAMWKGVDRDINERRLKFVGLQIDSVDRALSAALERQRAFHEQANSVDLGGSAKAYLESLLRLRETRQSLAMEEEALGALQAQLTSGGVRARQLGAYPAFLKSPAISDIIGRIGALDAERVSLLAQSRREDDPRIVAVRASVTSLEAQLEPLARTYGQSIVRERTTVDGEIDRINARLAALPDQVERGFRYSTEVERLSRTLLALHAQRVQLRLAAVGEGGDARVVDVARTQWRRSFPSRPITLIASVFAGLAVGAALVLLGVGPSGPVSRGSSPEGEGRLS